jgi:O-methyltransferase involved in polyketide biosynthesis
MSAKVVQNLSGVSETALITLYTRALESQRSDALLKDEKAVELVRRMDCDFSRFKMHGHDEISLILRVRKFDSLTREFLTRNPAGVVVHIGCGLDTRFDRVDNGQVEWYDLDLPDVIALRQKLFEDTPPRYHLLSGSVFGDEWLSVVGLRCQRPVLFLAEGVLPYFEEAQVKALVLKLCGCFPGAELVCDAHTPFILWADNLQLASSGIHARLRWSLKHGRDMESWDSQAGIVLLDEWFYFDRPEPRMGAMQWLRHTQLRKSSGIFHYRLGPKV